MRTARTGFGVLLVLVVLVIGSLAAVTSTAGTAASPSSPVGTTAPSTAESSVPVSTPSDHVLSLGEYASISLSIPSTGTPPYSWSWLYSTNNGVDFTPATAEQCQTPAGSGAGPGTIVTCRFTATATTLAGTYDLELRVRDSASAPESIVSPAPYKVTVLAPSAADATAPSFDTDPGQFCTGTCTQSNWFGGSGGSGALTLTTSAANELLVLEISDSGQSTAALTSSDISDTQSSTWHLAASNGWNGTGWDQYVFYAIDPTAGADTVTVDTVSSSTTTATATALLAAFTGVDTSAPIAAVGAFASGTGTAGLGNVTANVSPTTILGVLSTSDVASTFVPTSSPAFTESGSVNDAVATSSYLEYYAATTTGTYLSQPSWTGSAAWGEVAVAVQGASPLSVTVSPTSVTLDQGQSKTFTATESGGSGSFAYTWSIASGACPGLAASGTASQAYTPSGTTSSCVLTVTVSDTPGDSAQPAVPAAVTVNSALTAPAAPTVSATALDFNQAETVTGTLASTGTAPYAWQWEVSVSGGAYGSATQCATNSGTGASGGAVETCSISASTLTSGSTYAFKLAITDSASTTESATSAASATITVKTALVAPAAPTVSATALDVNQALTVSGTIPSTGTSTYSWQWLVSVNGGAYAAASQCSTSSGTGASGGSVKTCSTAANALTPGNTYTFELQATDSATTPETQTSSASPVVTVASQLTAPSTPSPSATKLDVNQALTVTSTLSSTGTSPYSWQWEVSLNGGSYAATSLCAVNSGSGASGGATETCSIAANALTASDTYAFKLMATDSASNPESPTSSASPTVTVAATLTAPLAPTLSATALDVNQALTVSGTVPTTGTSTYSYQWSVSVNGGSFVATTQCSHNSGSGASAGAVETCSIAASTLTVGTTYAFEFAVTDSATSPESQTSPSSGTVTVTSALTAAGAPSPSASLLDVDQALAVTGTVPSTGTSPYAWQWLLSVNSGTYGASTQCSTNSGSGASAGATETCSIAGGALIGGDSYKFELKITDSATTPETTTSTASSSVAVSSALTAPSAPTISSNPIVDLGQTATLTAALSSTGTAPYSWQWLFSTNGGTSYASAASSQCATPSGSGGSAGATETCSFATTVATTTGSYLFELKVTDGATTPETATSPASGAVTVNSALTAASTPSPSATSLDADQVLSVTSSVPSSGTSPYAWQWEVSLNGGAFASTSLCATNSGSGASGGATETCSIAANALTAGATYGFELGVTDSASTAQSTTSASSSLVTVSSALTSAATPSPSATALDVNQVLTVTGTIPTSGTAPYSWQWRVSANGGSYLVASQCGSSASGSGATGGATETCSIPASTLSAGSNYAFELQVTDHATVAETTDSAASSVVAVSSTLAAGPAPTPAASALDVNQVLTVTAHLPTTGTAPYSWQWLVEVNGAGGYADATACGASSSGSGGASNAAETCTVPAGTLTASDSYSFELQATDSATSDESVTSAASSAVAVSTALLAPAAPLIASDPVVDLGQTATLTGVLSTTGSSPYAWQWLYSTNGGTSYSGASSSQCATPSGSGGAAGATETCSFATTGSTTTGSYLFELKVTDSATTAEVATSPASSAVTVHSALTAPAAPTVSAAKIDANQVLTVSTSVPSTGTTPYAWQWLVSVNSGTFAAASQCSTNSGTGASAGATETCTVSANGLTGGDSYTFELKVTDGATVPTSATSPASSSVAVSSTLVAPAAPTISAGALVDLGQSATLTASLPTTGTAPYSWSWWYSTNGGSTFSSATASQCATPSGSSGSAGATETCTFATTGSTVTGSYLFELKVTDSASVTESATSLASPPVGVSSTLTAPAAPTVSATSLDADQSLTVSGILPSTGTSPYGWHWMVSVNGGGFVSATQCNTNGGSGAAAAAHKQCVIPGGTLTAGTTYAFELHLNDSASTNEVATSPASATVTTSSSLTAGTPTPPSPLLDLGQSILLTSNPSGGSGSYSAFQWYEAPFSDGSCGSSSEIVGATNSTLFIDPTNSTCYLYNVTDSNNQNATSFEVVVTVNPALTAPATPTPSAAQLDLDQVLTVQGILPTNGTANYSWQWMVSVNGAGWANATQCSANNGTNGAADGSVTCTVAAGSLHAGDSYAFELNVTDSATNPESVVSAASTPVAVHTALLSPSAPVVSGAVLDQNQGLTVSGTIPATGTGPYAWTWWVSKNGASPILATECTVDQGTGAPGSAVESCVVPGNALVAGDNYTFSLMVVDSASSPENATSPGSSTVFVHSALEPAAGPAVSASKLDADQPLTITAPIPSTGTAPYDWQWLLATNGSTFEGATVCAVDQGTAALAGATETCAIAPDQLAPGASYTFELSATDNASAPATVDSPASIAVAVSAPLLAGSLTPNAPTIDAGQSIVLSANAVGGSPVLAYQWYSGSTASGCSGLTSPLSGASSGSVTVSPTVSTFYCYTVVDGASVTETATSSPVELIVHSALTAPAAPSSSAASIGSGQGLTITGVIPSTGTPTYAWQWLVSTNGGAFVDASPCAVSSGSGAAAGATETCVIASGELVAGDSYQFELSVTDGASVPTTATSAPSATVDVTGSAPSSFPWVWVAIGIAVIAAALVALLVLRRRRTPAPTPDVPEAPTPSAAPAGAPAWRESPDTAATLSTASSPVWQEKTEMTSVPVAALPSEAPAPPMPTSMPPTPVELPPIVAPVEVPAPTPPPTAVSEPAPTLPEPVVTPATEPVVPTPLPDTAPPPAAPPPTDAAPAALDFDSVMAELDDLSRQILRKSQRPPGAQTDESKTDP